MSTIPVVRFNDPDEFVQEILRDAESGRVQSNIVRITNRFQTSKLSPNIQHVTKVATALVGTHTTSKIVATPVLVRLEYYCGDYWGEGFDRKALEKAEEVGKKLESALEGFDIRGGVFEVNDDA